MVFAHPLISKYFQSLFQAFGDCSERPNSYWYCCIAGKDNNVDAQKYNVSFLFLLISKIYEMVEREWGRQRERIEDGWDVHTGARYESTVNRFFFVLLSRDWYWATTRHWIILGSLRFLLSQVWYRAIPRHRIILVSYHFSAFPNLAFFQDIKSS